MSRLSETETKDCSKTPKVFYIREMKEIEFKLRDWVFLKYSPMKGVLRFRKKGKLSARYIGLFQILKKFWKYCIKIGFIGELDTGSSYVPCVHAQEMCGQSFFDTVHRGYCSKGIPVL